MNITNNIAALAKRFANVVATIAILGASFEAASAMNSVDQAACPGAGCEVVAAATVDADQWGGLKITDAKGRSWSLVSFQDRPLVDIGSPVEWSDGFAVIAAHDRYSAALSRGEGLGVGPSSDGRYHLCVSNGALTCVYVPAG